MSFFAASGFGFQTSGDATVTDRHQVYNAATAEEWKEWMFSDSNVLFLVGSAASFNYFRNRL